MIKMTSRTMKAVQLAARRAVLADLPGPVASADGLLMKRGQAGCGGLAGYRALRPVFSGEVREDRFRAYRRFAGDRLAAAVKVPGELDDLRAPFIVPAGASPHRDGQAVEGISIGASPFGIGSEPSGATRRGDARVAGMAEFTSRPIHLARSAAGSSGAVHVRLVVLKPELKQGLVAGLVLRHGAGHGRALRGGCPVAEDGDRG
jgi:hypothetical protein